MCLTQGHNTVTLPVASPLIPSLMLYQLSHCAPYSYCLFKHIHLSSTTTVCSSTSIHYHCMFKHVSPLLLYIQAAIVCSSTFTHCICMFKHIHPLLFYAHPSTPTTNVFSSTFTHSCCMFKHNHPLLLYVQAYSPTKCFS